MKSFLFIPKHYSLASTIGNSLTGAGIDSEIIDPVSLIPGYYKWVNGQIFRLNNAARKRWRIRFEKNISEAVLKRLNQFSPELIVIYNHMNLTCEVFKECKKRNIRIVFVLGDSPLYSDTLATNLKLLEYADTIIVPDTYWKQQLEISGLKNVIYFQFPLPNKTYYKIQENIPSEHQLIDTIYAGNSYSNSWGYKKLKYISYFADTNLRIYGNSTWNTWLKEFPEVQDHFIKTDYISETELNMIYNHSKLMPVDGNPGLINGMHIRVSEALSAGVLPIIEWRKDIYNLFKSIKSVPLISEYSQIKDTVKYYLENEKERIETVDAMVKLYASEFPSSHFGELLKGNI